MISPSPESAALKRAIVRLEGARARYISGRYTENQLWSEFVRWIQANQDYMANLQKDLEGKRAQEKAGETE